MSSPRPGQSAAPNGSPRTLAWGLLVSGLVHLLVLATLVAWMPQPPRAVPEEALDVLILKDAGVAAPTPDPNAALSQRSRAGESPKGDNAPTSRTGLTGPPEPIPEGTEALAEAAPEPDPTPPPQPIAADADRQSASALPQAEPEHPAPVLYPLAAERPPPVDTAQILASRNLEILRLTASLEARSAAYASRPRRKSVSASTREFRYASYMGAWTRKVERIGNLNYPQAAREQHLYGSLILNVAVRRDGSVEGIRVVRSSGNAQLDQAAVRIVELAAPYSPFPPDIAADVDVLDIVRTWQFLPNGRFGG